MKYTSISRSIVAVLVAGTLAACGSSTETTSAPATAAPVAAAPASTSAPATAAPASTSAPAATTTVGATVAPTASAQTRLNLNTVTGDELLATIPDFSNRMVREFEEYRPYVSIQQFRREIGKYVDEAQVTEYEQYVYVPVDVDNADAATLQQIPGVTQAIADQLIAGRPYGSNDAFLNALGALGIDATTAASYLAQ